jgi:hypothetical protein
LGLAAAEGAYHTERAGGGPTLEDVCLRVSCGVATGADKVFVHRTAAIPDGLRRFAYPTVAGRELVPGQKQVRTRQSILFPYSTEGELLPIDDLAELSEYLSRPAQRRRLGRRTCAARKPWHAFHDSVPLREILRPKLLCKDITATPEFWCDRGGAVVPLHSVYYIVPRDPARLDDLAAYLTGTEARRWLTAHCQRAANGFLRLQSAILKKLPVPAVLGGPGPDEVARRPVRNYFVAGVFVVAGLNLAGILPLPCSRRGRRTPAGSPPRTAPCSARASLLVARPLRQTCVTRSRSHHAEAVARRATESAGLIP